MSRLFCDSSGFPQNSIEVSGDQLTFAFCSDSLKALASLGSHFVTTFQRLYPPPLPGPEVHVKVISPESSSSSKTATSEVVSDAASASSAFSSPDALHAAMGTTLSAPFLDDAPRPHSKSRSDPILFQSKSIAIAVSSSSSSTVSDSSSSSVVDNFFDIVPQATRTSSQRSQSLLPSRSQTHVGHSETGSLASSLPSSPRLVSRRTSHEAVNASWLTGEFLFALAFFFLKSCFLDWDQILGLLRLFMTITLPCRTRMWPLTRFCLASDWGVPRPQNNGY